MVLVEHQGLPNPTGGPVSDLPLPEAFSSPCRSVSAAARTRFVTQRPIRVAGCQLRPR